MRLKNWEPRARTQIKASGLDDETLIRLWGNDELSNIESEFESFPNVPSSIILKKNTQEEKNKNKL